VRVASEKGCKVSETLSIPLINRQQAWDAIKAQVFPYLHAVLQAERRLVLTIKPEKRSLKENALLHALLTHIAEQLEWAGQKRDVETWKRLITAAWCRARGEHVELLPAIDGNGVDIVFRRTSQLTRGECAELIEFLYAWAAQAGVRFPERVDPETGEIT